MWWYVEEGLVAEDDEAARRSWSGSLVAGDGVEQCRDKGRLATGGAEGRRGECGVVRVVSREGVGSEA